MYDQMNKAELRAACKEAGIKYGALDNAGMRAALEAKYTAPRTIPGETVQLVSEQVTSLPIDQQEDAPDAGSDPTEEEAAAGAEREAKNAPAPTGLPVDRHTEKGLKIEKDREERNGIKRPSVGGKCRAIWDYLDGLVAVGVQPTAKHVKQQAENCAWNPNNAVIEFYQWRKFNGITGRSN